MIETHLQQIANEINKEPTPALQQVKIRNQIIKVVASASPESGVVLHELIQHTTHLTPLKLPNLSALELV